MDGAPASALATVTGHTVDIHCSSMQRCASTPRILPSTKIKASMPAYVFEVWNIREHGKLATPEAREKTREKRHLQLHPFLRLHLILHGCCLCPQHLSQPHKTPKQPLHPPLGLLRCHHRRNGVHWCQGEPFLCSENRGCSKYRQAKEISNCF